MSPLAANDIEVICRAQLRGEGRWVSLALSLGAITSANRFLVTAERLLYEVEGADEPARRYGLLNWQGGVISGARCAFRVLKAPAQQVCLHELRGRLGSGDVWAVSAAASLAVGRLLGRPDIPLDLGGWRVEEVGGPQAAEEIRRSAQVVSSEPESPPGRAEDLSSSTGTTETTQARQDIPAAPGAAAGESRAVS